MKKLLLTLALLMVVLFSTNVFAVTAFWDHSAANTVFKYKVAWGTAHCELN